MNGDCPLPTASSVVSGDQRMRLLKERPKDELSSYKLLLASCLTTCVCGARKTHLVHLSECCLQREALGSEYPMYTQCVF